MKDCSKKAAFPKAVLLITLAILLIVSPLVSFAEDGDGVAADSVPSVGLSVEAEAEKDGSDSAKNEAAESGDGTEAEEVFSEELAISSEEELRVFAQRVNGGDSMSGVLVKLAGNITVAGDTLWVPIGNDALTPFSGVFDGQGYKVEGFQVSNDVNGGLFGFLLNAKIRNLTLTNFAAGNSTGGMFFSAIGTTVEMSRSQVNGITTMSFVDPLTTAVDIWTGVDRTLSMIAVNGVYTINSAADLAYIADQVNLGFLGNDFAGETISLAINLDMTGGTWTPIGDYFTMTPFKGRFVGNGLTIKGLDNALFGYTEEATISKIALEDSHVTAADDAVGALIHVAETSVISQIEILNSSIDATVIDGAGGVIGRMDATLIGSGYSAISQVFVENTHVKGDDGVVGGIVGYAEAVSISECVMYGGSVTNTAGDVASGIVGIFGNAAFAGGMRDCLVLGTDFGSATKVAGLTWIDYTKAAVTNNVVSDIRSSATPSASLTSVYLGIGSELNAGGFQYNFTDSSLGYRFIDDPAHPGATMDGIINNYWDSQRELAAGLLYDLPSGVDHNQAMSTATLTNGTWVPNQESWTAAKNFYPQLGSLSRKTWNTAVPLVSAAASLALVPGSVEDNYVVGAGELFLPGHVQVDGDNVAIDWSGYDTLVSSGQLKKTSVDGGIKLSATGADVTISDITATIRADGAGSYSKRFDNVTLADTTLEFSHSVPANRAIVDETLPTITVVFDEAIGENPLASGKLAELQVLVGSQYVQQEVFYLDSTIETPSRFAVSTDSSGRGQAVFTLGNMLRPGKKYRLVLPLGAVQQQGNDRALSDHVALDFSTAEVGKPVINFAEELEFPLDQVFAIGDLLSNVVIKDFDGASLYDGAVGSSPITPQEYAGILWDSTNTNKSQKDILDSMPASSIRYVVADPDVFDLSAREAGVYQIYFIAKNAKGKGAYRVMPVTLKGSPEWLNEPDPVVHIQWTKDKQAFIDAAKQNAIAAIPQKNGSSVPCSVEVVFNEQDWLNSLAFTEGPFTIETQVVASEAAGGVTSSLPVTVYLDKPLYYTLTPTPITMSLATPRQVEERVNVLAINFNKNIVKYDHWDNNYRKPGRYYVDIYSDPQNVTDCQLAKCSDSNHPENVVNSVFAVNIVQTPGAEITSFWGTAMAELDAAVAGDSTKESDYPYSKNIVRVSPQTYRMPAFVPEYLKKQAYGRMEVNYGDYRWNLYSNTLDVWNLWGDEYNMEATLDSVDNGAGNAVQVKFVQEGRLFGTVEFDISMDAARKLAPNLPDENLGLYRYDGRTRELVLISDVIVEEGKWASALLQDIYPTAYVLKTKGVGDVMVSSGPDDLIQFYVHTKVVDPDTRMISDGDAELVTLPTDRTELINLITGQVSQELPGIGTAGDGGAESPKEAPRAGLPLTAIIIAAIVLLLAGGSVAAVILIRRREGK